MNKKNAKLASLIFRLASDDVEQGQEAAQAIQKICRNSMLPQRTRIQALEAIYKSERSDVGADCLAASRDSLKYLEGKKKNLEVSFLCGCSESVFIDSFERLLNVVCLYNLGHFEVCYELFSKLSKCCKMLLSHRLEALKFLVFSEEEEHIETARSTIMDITKDLQVSSPYRYKFAAEFSKTGCLKSLCNIERLWATAPAEFIKDIQESFFSVKEHNDIPDNVLSAQCLLQLVIVDEEKKAEIMEWLAQISENFGLGNENFQADACDVLLRLGTAKYRTRAQTVLNIIAQSKMGMTTVYTDKQNVHTTSLNESVMEFLEKCMEEETPDCSDFPSVHAKVVRLVTETLKDEDQKKALAALDRISVDTATFTDYDLQLSDVFVIIWKRIEKKDAISSKQMAQRLLEELVDMAATCSSGHCSRLVNSLSYFEANIRIGFREQVRANFSARMNSRIRNIKDVELQSSIICGMGDSETTEDRTNYIKFIHENFEELRQELHKEFVGGGYVSQEQFDVWSQFSDGDW
ncbi:hypothetical protein A9K97_gp240 [Tokyovirus A1]|uniref:hypothetical protein n=1 Tax=Tokyovirus A1 TaxID=1826170 RepID=UPI0007A98CA1|nr:hypothetical protein A9K97_gp240 [Tokyovirus A1]BAU80111.1 hypothetical protein [Tokyovirus A1]